MAFENRRFSIILFFIFWLISLIMAENVQSAFSFFLKNYFYDLKLPLNIYTLYAFNCLCWGICIIKWFIICYSAYCIYSNYCTQEFTMKCISAMQQYMMYVSMYLYGILWILLFRLLVCYSDFFQIHYSDHISNYS